MIDKDSMLSCSVCGEKIGIMSLAYFGIPQHTEPRIFCVKCLPKRLEHLENEGFDKDRIEVVRKWLEERK